MRHLKCAEVMEDFEEDVDTLSASITCIMDLPPSCVEFCPNAPQFFVVGTYKLDDLDHTTDPEASGQKRRGNMVLYELRDRDLWVETADISPKFHVLCVRVSGVPG